MRTTLLLVLIAGITACKPATKDDAPAKVANVPTAQVQAGSPAEPFKFVEENELIDFSYSYPAEATAIPPLARQLKGDMARIKAEAIGFATEDRDGAAEMSHPFHGHYLHKGWITAGDSPRVLSLVATTESFTGGAHGNSGFSALLWDRQAGREIRFLSLFAEPARLEQLMRSPYCSALVAERLKRREGEVLEGQFSECPKTSELVVIPSDEDGDRRFEHIRFLAGPYVAGPYVEGEYEISLPIPQSLVAALKPEYRDSFESQLQ